MRRSLLVALVIGFAAPAFAASYEMKDLEALEKSEGWQEAVEHLGDIPPSKRDKNWDRIAEKATAATLLAIDPAQEGNRHGSETPRALTLADDLLKRYPTLKKSKAFMQARTDAAIKGFTVTFQNSRHSSGDDPWLVQVKAFAATENSPDVYQRVGKIISGRLVGYIAIPFYKPALASNGGLCKDKDVQAAIVSAVTSNVWMDDAKAMADKCWGDVKGGIETEVKKEDAEESRKNACPVLAAHKDVQAVCK